MILTIGNVKGGVGKTTLAVNIGSRQRLSADTTYSMADEGVRGSAR